MCPGRLVGVVWCYCVLVRRKVGTVPGGLHAATIARRGSVGRLVPALTEALVLGADCSTARASSVVARPTPSLPVMYELAPRHPTSASLANGYLRPALEGGCSRSNRA